MGHDPQKRYPDIEIDRALLGHVDLGLFANEPSHFEDEDVQEIQMQYSTGSKPRLEIIDGRSFVWSD